MEQQWSKYSLLILSTPVEILFLTFVIIETTFSMGGV